jgi:DNA polymerase I
MTMRPVFYIIDGHAVAYRQFHGLPVRAFSTSSGEPTNATYGFARILLDLILNVKPAYLAVSFDRGLSGREEIFPDYKGTREKMPEELAIQISRIYEVVSTFNIPVLALDGYEADDIIGTVARQAERAGVDVRIVTGDRDLLQLLTEHVTVQLPSRRDAPDEVYDIPRFIEKYGVRPDQLVDMKALTGDSSDNIPGVAGIGEKTAAKLLQDYDTLDGVFEHLDQQKGALRTRLESGRDLAYLSRELAQIRYDVPVELNLEACVSHDFDVEAVLALFQELEFRTFTSRLMEHNNAGNPISTDLSIPQDGIKTVIIRDEAALHELAARLNKAKAIVWDVETTSVDQMRAKLVGIALSIDGKTGYYIPVGHVGQGVGTLFEEPAAEQLPLDVVIVALREPLTNANIPKYAHNAVYDYVVMVRHGIPVEPIRFDSMIAEWLLDPTSKFLGLKSFSAQYFDYHMTPITDLIGTGRKQKLISEVPIDDVAPYAAADAVITFHAVHFLRDRLEQAQLMTLYETMELPLIPVIAAMEQTGVALDVDYLKGMSDRLEVQLQDLAERIFAQSGGYGPFNINSPKQLNEVLFGTLKLPVRGLQKTTHGYSTDVVALQTLQDDTQHPIIDLLVEYRELTKLKGTYVDALPQLVNPVTGRLHTSYNQTGTSTGRLSSSDPNLQNIPIRTEIGREVRRAFIAPPGSVLIAVDYSQIELRVLAHISQDQTLLDAFAQGQDIHKATAAAVFGISLDDVTYEQRSFAKRVNFGLIYGMGAFRLARDSDLTHAEATEFIETYFKRLPGVEAYIEGTKRQASQQGYVETLFGRRRYFNALQSGRSSRNNIEAELRAAINMPIQGTAADIMKRAMINLHDALEAIRCLSLMILQVHDELVLEVPEAEIREDPRSGGRGHGVSISYGCTIDRQCANRHQLARYGRTMNVQKGDAGFHFWFVSQLVQLCYTASITTCEKTGQWGQHEALP